MSRLRYLYGDSIPHAELNGSSERHSAGHRDADGRYDLTRRGSVLLPVPRYWFAQVAEGGLWYRESRDDY